MAAYMCFFGRDPSTGGAITGEEQTMSDQGATAFPSQTMMECGICDSTFNVSWFCKNCAGSLCDTCKQNHQKASLFRKHMVVPRTIDVLRLHGPAKIAEICRLHQTKEVSTYCNDCKVPCCVLCLSEKHQRHGFSPIEERYLSAEKDLDQYVKQLKADVRPALDEMKESIKQNLDVNKISLQKVKEEVNTFRRTLKQEVDESCDLLLQELDKSQVDFSYKEQEIDSRMHQVDTLIRDIELMIGEGKLHIIEYSPPNPRSLIPDSSFPILKVPIFVPGIDLISNIQQKTGKIEFDKDEGRNKSLAWPPKVYQENFKLLSESELYDKASINIKAIESFNIQIRPSSLTVTGNGTAWVTTFDSSTIYLYNNKGIMIGSVDLMSSKGISDLAIRRSGEIIVTCKDKKVRRMSKSYVHVVSTFIDTNPFSPKGVCLTDKDEVVVCMNHQDTGNHVAVFSPDGSSKLRVIRGVDGQGTQQVIAPYRIVLNGKDLCVVNGSRNVVCVDEKDSVRWVYDGKDAALKESFGACGICVDKYHNLLVIDHYNNCVHYIDREGKLLQVIFTEDQTGLCNHWNLSVDDESGYVWLGSDSGNVVIANYLQ